MRQNELPDPTKYNLPSTCLPPSSYKAEVAEKVSPAKSDSIEQPSFTTSDFIKIMKASDENAAKKRENDRAEDLLKRENERAEDLLKFKLMLNLPP